MREAAPAYTRLHTSYPGLRATGLLPVGSAIAYLHGQLL